LKFCISEILKLKWFEIEENKKEENKEEENKEEENKKEENKKEENEEWRKKIIIHQKIINVYSKILWI